MNTKTLLLSAFISMLLLSAAAGTLFVPLGKANPNPTSVWYNIMPRPDFLSDIPPVISIESPKNNTFYVENSLNLTVSVSVVPTRNALKNTRFIQEITYKADWLSEVITVYRHNYSESVIDDFSTVIALTDIPEGKHNVVVNAVERDSYYEDGISGMLGLHPVVKGYSFTAKTSSAVTFNIDAVPPEVSILQTQKTFTDSTAAPLNFTVNEPVSQIWYVLDEQENVTVTGNTTLTDLSYGEHNVTVYATDMAGNTGESETVYFIIEEPLPTTMVIAPIASIALIGVGLVVYFQKRKK